MANAEHLAILKSGGEEWNSWREENEDVCPNLYRANLSGASLFYADLSGADLRQANLQRADFRYLNLYGANLSGANLNGANLVDANIGRANLIGVNFSGANLVRVNLNDSNLSGTNLGGIDLINSNLINAILTDVILTGADLSYTKLINANLINANLVDADFRGANLTGANLTGANLTGANLFDANLSGVNFTNANLTNANLTDANLCKASFLKTTLRGAILNNCNIYGVSVWDIEGEIKEQKNLIITPPDQPEVTVDNIKVAQFIYLLLKNKEIRDVIDTLTARAVLILGRFTDERKKVLDNLKDTLRKRGYLPILFDFEKPGSRNLTETIKTLAGISRFVIADITDAKAVIHELMAIIPHYPSIPIQPLLLTAQEEYGMFEDFRPYPWVCEAYRYDSPETLLANLELEVIGPAERKVIELKGAR